MCGTVVHPSSPRNSHENKVQPALTMTCCAALDLTGYPRAEGESARYMTDGMLLRECHCLNGPEVWIKCGLDDFDVFNTDIMWTSSVGEALQ